ncbi:hypothetical protein SAY86_027035 [Trapa natans]|uniref:Uncharacterized protein n=1 Tax=Trapa natans TaxID=22666 RepID=A0AAN7KLN4_TRANT|nr:hypothetical protein SAY86_027035 [Trapa natans]
MGGSSNTMAPLLLRNLVGPIFILADKSLINLAEWFKALDVLRCFIVSSSLFFIRLLLSFAPSVKPANFGEKFPVERKHGIEEFQAQLPVGVGDSGIARSLSQLLAIVNNVPVSSRKYEAVRSLAERLIDENLRESNEALRDVNRKVISAAFTRTLTQLETTMMEQERALGSGFSGSPAGSAAVPIDYYGLNRILRAMKSFSYMALGGSGTPREGLALEGCSSEKLASELLWLAQKLVASGCAEEAVCRWSTASNMAWLAVSAEPRLQGLLVKVSAFLFKQAKDLTLSQTDDETEKEQQRQMKMKMLTSWLPLLCRASNGTDAPVLSIGERAELERVLEETIEMLEQEEEQEQVLSQWLHHFMYCPSSDWPNLHSSYIRWCTASRKLFLCPGNSE